MAKSQSETADDYGGFLFPLSEDYRLVTCRHGIQWIIQRKKQDGWRNIAFCRTRDGLLARLFDRVTGIPVMANVLPLLSALPERI